MTDFNSSYVDLLDKAHQINKEVSIWLTEMKDLNARQSDIAFSATKKSKEIAAHVNLPIKFIKPIFSLIMAKYKDDPRALDKFKDNLLKMKRNIQEK